MDIHYFWPALPALFIALGLVRWLGRRLGGGRRRQLSRWQENRREALQRERLRRQSIGNGAPQLVGGPAKKRLPVA